MNARLEAAARALYEASVYGNDRGWRWDELDAETHERFRRTVGYVLAAADALDTTECAQVHIDQAGRAFVVWYGGDVTHERRVGPWVSVTEGNDQ